MKQYDHDWLIAEWGRMGRPEVQYATGINKDFWVDDEEPDFNVNCQYRIKSKPWINWGHVSDDYFALVTDGNGFSYLWSCIPETFAGLWDGDGKCISANAFTSFITGTCDWRDSLVMRPVVIGDS